MICRFDCLSSPKICVASLHTMFDFNNNLIANSFDLKNLSRFLLYYQIEVTM